MYVQLNRKDKKNCIYIMNIKVAAKSKILNAYVRQFTSQQN